MGLTLRHWRATEFRGGEEMNKILLMAVTLLVSIMMGAVFSLPAIAQVYEVVWQWGGGAGGRQVEGAKAGLAINKGLFGNGSCVIVKR